jgi:hypothetical protein
MAVNQKDTVYIDVDDEITAIIDKVVAAKARIVALVLPKRAAVLQSIVNMKLLKRSAESAKKHVVLITTEAGLLPLAGAVGMYVAPSLQSKPVIPIAPDGVSSADIDESADFDPDAAADQPVGQLAGPAAVMKDDMETIELDNGDEDSEAEGGVAAGAAAGAGAASLAKSFKPKKDSKLKIPDFNKFRLGIILAGVVLVGLLVFGYFAMFVLPAATVTIATDSSEITTSSNLTLDPAAKELDVEEKVFPAKIEKKQVNGSQQVTASGQKNKGERATGQVTLSLKDCSQDEVTVPAGTGVSANGKTFITQDNATMQSVKVGSKCSNSSFPGASAKTVDVVAQKGGADYNIAASTFTVASFSSLVSGQSSDSMAGGTDNIVKVVSQSDVDSAKQKIASQNGTAAAKAELQSKLEDEGYFAITSSAQASEPVVTPSAQVGDEADTVTVTTSTTYTMYGVKKSDVEDFIVANIKDKINPSKQQILNKGVDKATFDITSPATSGPLQVAFSATSQAGPDIKTDALKSQIAGKKTNDVRTIAKQTPGVTDVTVKYSPFWVSKVPKKESKITIVIEKANASSTGTDTSNGNTP